MGIAVVVKEAGKEPHLHTMHPERDGWHRYGDVINGFPGIAMRADRFFDDGDDLTVYCDDNGLARELPLNFLRPSDQAPVVGTVVAVKGSRMEDRDSSMSDADAQKVIKLLSNLTAQPEVTLSLIQEGRPKTPWAVVCPQHRQVFLSEDEYMYQMMRPDSTWKCPICGMRAGFDDDNYEAAYADMEPDEDD